MAKARILKVINYREEDIPALAELEKVLRREKKQFSEWAREQTVIYAKAHGKGNPTFALDRWASDPAFKAWPTAWQDPPLKELKNFSVKELREMMDYLERWSWVIGKKLEARGEK